MHKLILLALVITLASCATPAKDTQSTAPSILLHSRDAVVHGTTLRYEPQEHKNTLGFWTHEQDYATWDFVLERAGMFDVEVLQGCGKDQGGSTVEVVVAGQSLTFTVQDTGHFQNFVPRVIGRVKLPRGIHTFTVRPLKKAHNAVMDLRQVRLLPVEE